MDGSRGHVWRPLAGRVRPRRTTARQRHLAFENDVRGVNGMSVIGIEGVRCILPCEDVAESLLAELLLDTGASRIRATDARQRQRWRPTGPIQTLTPARSRM